MNSVFSSFFDPNSIAVIASLREGWMGGYVIVKSLLNAGYKGDIYPINPSYGEVLGQKVFSSLKDVGSTIDLAVIMVNARSVPNLIKECGDISIRSVIVVSDGFAERDHGGLILQNEIVTIARRQGIRIIGPNTVGIVNSRNGLMTCPYDPGYYRFREGPISIFSQTGMTNPQAFPYPSLRFGISKICDLGNKCDLDECDLLEYLEKDPTTEVISMYLESIRDGRRFLEISKRVASKKPLLALKSGRTLEGARASASHTGSLAVNDKIFNTACGQAGILRLGRFQELFDIPKVFASQYLPNGNRLGIVTQSGAFGVLAIDEGAKYGLVVKPLTPETTEKLDKIFPGLGKNPVDVGPAASVLKNFFRCYLEILSAVMGDENVDCVFNAMWAGDAGKFIETYISAYKKLKGRFLKPLVTWISGPSVASKTEVVEYLEELGFPVFDALETSVKALGLAFRYAKIKRGGRLFREKINKET